jgi:hypothetical protein
MEKIKLMKEDGELLKFMNGDDDDKDLEVPLDIEVRELK